MQKLVKIRNEKERLLRRIEIKAGMMPLTALSSVLAFSVKNQTYAILAFLLILAISAFLIIDLRTYASLERDLNLEIGKLFLKG